MPLTIAVFALVTGFAFVLLAAILPELQPLGLGDLSVAANRAAAQAFYAAQDAALATGDDRGLLTVVDPAFVDHQPGARAAWGRDDLVGELSALRKEQPGLRLDAEPLLVAGDRVLVAVRMRAGNSDNAAVSAPTPRAGTLETLDVVRVADGVVAERWSLSGNLATQASQIRAAGTAPRLVLVADRDGDRRRVGLSCVRLPLTPRSRSVTFVARLRLPECNRTRGATMPGISGILDDIRGRAMESSRVPIDTHAPHGSRPLDEAAIIARARQDPAAFAPLYQAYLGPVYRYCYRRLASREAAEDATSLIFERVLRSLPTFRGASFRAWLFSIAHNTITDAYRRQGTASRLTSVRLTEAAEVSDPRAAPEQVALLADEQRLLSTALALLPAEQRQVIELRLSGIPSTEVAQILGRSPQAIRALQLRATRRLQVILSGPSAAREVRHARTSP